MAPTKVSMKLLIGTKGEKFYFLFHLLCSPLGTVVRLLTKNGMVGSIGNFYASVEDPKHAYMQPNHDKNVVLNPIEPFSFAEVSGLLPANEDVAGDNFETAKFYVCPKRCNHNVTGDDQTPCPHCNTAMIVEVRYVGKDIKETSSNKSGFVKEIVTHMVMDDLVIQAM